MKALCRVYLHDAFEGTLNIMNCVDRKLVCCFVKIRYANKMVCKCYKAHKHEHSCKQRTHGKLVNIVFLGTRCLVCLGLHPIFPQARPPLMTRVPFLAVALDKATYNCQWANTGSCKRSLTWSNDLPWDRLMVNAKAKRTGYWSLTNEMDKAWVSQQVGLMRGSKTTRPLLAPVTISA